ncbi:MAG: rod shape-determining protein RodA [candidate division WOR-3 bacterium]
MAKRHLLLEKNINLRHNIILTIVLLIVFLGSLTMFSISRSKNSPIFEKHITNIIFSLLFYFFFLKIKIPNRFPFLYFLIVISLLLIPLFISPYPKRWIKISSFSFQPSEIAKIPFFISLAVFLEEKPYLNFKDASILFIMCLLPFILILSEPDLGQGIFYISSFYLIILLKRSDLNTKLFYIIPPLSLLLSFNHFIFLFFMIFFLIFLTYIKMKILNKILFFIIAIIVGLFSPIVWNKLLKDYQKERIRAFLNLSRDPKGSGWQVSQGLIAIGSGGIKGKGFLKGSQKGLAFLPAAHSDFIFASFSEEFGFIGSLFLFFLYFLLFINILNLMKNMDSFSYIFSLLTIFSFLYNFFLNIGGQLGILPLTGIPLPFLSYGGTHMLTNFLLLSLLRNFQRSFLNKG